MKFLKWFVRLIFSFVVLFTPFLSVIHAQVVPTDIPQALYLPVEDFRVKVQSAWSDHKARDNRRNVWGIDYVLGEYDNSRTWEHFRVLAAHDGRACANCGTGIGEFIKIYFGDSQTEFTYYGHLQDINSAIPNWSVADQKDKYLSIKAGDFVAMSSDSGAPGLIHLHFVAFNVNTFDPYDLSADRAQYYPGGSNFKSLGQSHFFSSDPPQYIQTIPLVIESPVMAAPAQVGSITAPQKFPLRLLAPSRLTQADFSIKIGGKVATLAGLTEVRTGVYDLDVIPPSQAASGQYPLTVQAKDHTVTTQNLIQYSTSTDAGASNVDISLVVDRSGSMSGSKIAEARAAAKQFVDLVRIGDGISVISFDDSPRIDVGHVVVGDDRTSIKTAIDGITDGGGKLSIGIALLEAKNQLEIEGSTERPDAIVLLTDGQDGGTPSIDEVIPQLKSAGIKVHTIAIGTDADTTLLSTLAQETGGVYRFSASSFELGEVYQAIGREIGQQETVASINRSVLQGVVDTFQVYVDRLKDVIFMIRWPGSDLDLVLESPSGRIIDPAVAASDPTIDFSSSDTLEFYRLQEVEPGVWKIHVRGVQVDMAEGEPYNAQISGTSDLNLSIATDRTTYIADDAIVVKARLSDAAPVLGAALSATVQTPSGVRVTLPLFDDGTNSDDTEADGTYTGIFSNTVESGNYNITVSASGTSNASESFTRLSSATVLVNPRQDPRFDLFLTGQPAASPIHAGQEVTYTLTFGNVGPDNAGNVAVTAILTESMTYVRDSFGGAAIVEEGTLQWNIGSLAAGSPQSMTLTLLVQPNVPIDSELSLYAGVGSAMAAMEEVPDPYDPVPANNSATMTVSTSALPPCIGDCPFFLPLLMHQTASDLQYKDDFSNPASGWSVWEDEVAKLSYQSGEYEVLVKQAGWLWRIPAPAADFSPAIVELDMRLVQAEVVVHGISIDFLEGNVSYAFFLDDLQNFSVQKLVNNQWHELSSWQPSSDIKPVNEVNHLRIEYGNGVYVFYVNDQQLASGTDSDLRGEASVGLFISTYAESRVPIIVRFDNVTIQTPP